MVDFFKFLLNSRNKELYYKIAISFGTSTRNVYKLAHGKKAKCNKDYLILKRLQEHDVIDGIRIG